MVKTIYDPSPVGYHLPPPDAFTGFTYSGLTTREPSEGDSYFGSQFNSPYTSSNDVGLNYGWTVYCNRMPGIGNYDTSGGVIFFPAMGGIVYRSGDMLYVYAYGGCWTAIPHTTGYAHFCLGIGEEHVAALAFTPRAGADPVRPVRE